MRLKFPIFETDSTAGWRVEFRPMGLQKTPFENAAIVTFVVLLTRALAEFSKIDLRVPISELEANVYAAEKRDACRQAKLLFRKYPDLKFVPTTAEYVRLSIEEIFLGKEGEFFGLLPLVRKYLESEEMEEGVRMKLGVYLEFIENRATGG